MNVRVLSLAAVAALTFCSLGIAGCSSDSTGTTPTPTDTGTPPSDSGDTGTPPADSGDTGTPPADSGDTGTPPADTGDAGTLSCDDYCTKATTTCVSPNDQYIDKATCLKVCAKFDVGKTSDTTGDTLGCRTYHVIAAAGSAADAKKTHCPHSGAYGGDMCGASRCDDFCKLALAQCPKTAGGPYTDVAACKAACPAFDATKPEIDASTSKGKLNCLQYHLQAAFNDPTTHCGHITVATGSPCAP
jgi:hypothetical protein